MASALRTLRHLCEEEREQYFVWETFKEPHLSTTEDKTDEILTWTQRESKIDPKKFVSEVR